jgi:hypothetical protein
MRLVADQDPMTVASAVIPLLVVGILFPIPHTY